MSIETPCEQIVKSEESGGKKGFRRRKKMNTKEWENVGNIRMMGKFLEKAVIALTVRIISHLIGASTVSAVSLLLPLTTSCKHSFML